MPQFGSGVYGSPYYHLVMYVQLHQAFSLHFNEPLRCERRVDQHFGIDSAWSPKKSLACPNMDLTVVERQGHGTLHAPMVLPS